MKKKDINKVNNVNIKEIKDPSFLHDLNYKELDVLASDIRKEIIKETSINGGHLSSNLGVVELTIALHRVFDLSKDKVIFDVGHQSYTHKILTGRSLENLRTSSGVSGFQKISESPYDCYEAGHSSTSISAAYGFAVARDLSSENYNCVAVIGDGSIINGLAFEALNDIPHSNHKVIIILNDNEMSISKPTGGLGAIFAKWSASRGYLTSKERYSRRMTRSKFGRAIFKVTRSIKNWVSSLVVPHNMFRDLGYYYIGPVNGHDIKSLEKAFANAKKTPKSVIIHTYTVKGKGYEPAENDENGSWHGVAPFDIESGESLNKHEGSKSWSKIFSTFLHEKMATDEKVIAISPATLKGSELEEVFADYKGRAFDVGICEEHAATMSSSLALSGYHPVVAIYSTFMQRAFDEISHDIARLKVNATFLVDRSGLVGADGETHMGIYDESFLVNTPNCVVTMPSSIDDANALFNESFNNHGPFFIRFPRGFESNLKLDTNYKSTFGKWNVKKDSNSKIIVVLAVGPLQNELLELLKDVDLKFYNCLYVNPLDEDALKDCLGYSNVVIYNPYATEGGFANSVISKLSELGYKGNIKSFVIANEFIKQGTVKEQLEKQNLLPEQVFSEISKL